MKRTAGIGTEVDPAELHQLPGGQIGRERPHEIAADERKAQRRSGARHLVEGGGNNLLLAACAVEVGLGGVQQVVADARVDERAAPVHVLDSTLEAPPLPLRAACGGLVRAVETVRADRARHPDVDSPDRVDQLLEAVEVDEDDVVHVQAGQVLDRPQGERGATELVGRVDLREPVLGNLDLKVPRDGEVCESPFARIGAQQHDRVGPVGALPAGAVAAVSPEDEDRRRCRDEQAVALRELPLDAGRNPVVRSADTARDRQVAPHGPRDKKDDQQHETERDPATRTARFPRRFW